MTALKAISGVAGSYKSDSASRFVIAENGLVTSAANTDNVFMGYVTGSSKSNFTIVYKTTSSDKVTTVKGARIDAKGNLVLGKSNADAEILIKDLKGFKSYSMADEGTLYVYTNSDDTITYVFKTSSGKYAYVKAEDIKGTIAEGEIFTITYGLYNGTYKKTNTTQTYKIVNGKLTTAGAEKGEYTAEGKGTLTINGFGDATLGEKSYKYSINAKNVVVLTGETTLGVTLDSEAKTYAEVASDGFVHTYINASNDKYTMVFDGFGGATLTYSSYVYSGTYTLGTGTVTIAKINYDYNKTYTIEESGNVLASTDGKTALAVKGYVVVNRLNEMNGFWQSADKAHSIEIIVKSEKKIFIKIDQSSVYFADGINYNGTKIMFRDDNLKNYCIDRTATGISMSDIAYSSATQTFDVDTTKIVGQWELFGDVYYVKCVFNADGKVDVARMSAFGTTKDTVAYTSEANVYTFTFKNTKYTCTLKADGSLDVSTLGTARKIADPEVSGGTPEETLDAFAGTWSGKVGHNNLTVVCDGKGNIKVGDTSYTYTITDGKIVVGDYTFTKSGDTIKAVYDDGEYSFDGTLTKQA